MERRQLTLMFTDIVGYSKLMGQNEGQTITLVGEYRRILLARIEEFNGRVVEFIGDAVFARFEQPGNAVDAGIAIQNDLALFNDRAPSGQPLLRTRIGIHTGEVAEKDGALYGDDVNIAARLEPMAVADGLCVSEPVYHAVKPHLTSPVKNLGELPLKNIETQVKAYLIRPAGVTAATHAHYALSAFQQKIQAYRYPLAIALVALIASGFYFIPRWLVPGYTANYVEIADFKNLMSEDGEADYFSAGVTEALRSQLADMEDVYILDPSKGVRGPVRLEGSVQKIGESLRIAYRLFRRKDNVQIAGGKLDGAYKDIFILQDRIVAEVGRYVAKEFDLKFFRPAALDLTSDVTAYDYYLKGMEYLRMPESHENFDKAISYMRTALVHDSKFAGANVGICRAYRGKFNLTNNMELLSKAETYCLIALKIDRERSDVHFALGTIYQNYGEYDRSIASLKTAIQIDHTNAEALISLSQVYQDQNKLYKAEAIFKKLLEDKPKYWRTYFDYSYFLATTGRLGESIDLLKKSLHYTPDNEPALSNLGGIYMYIGEFGKAADIFERTVDLVPTAISYSNLGTGYYYSGAYKKSILSFEMAVRISPNDFRLYINLADALRYVPGNDKRVKENCLKAIDIASEMLELNSSSAESLHFIALGYLYLGEVQKAESYILRANESRPNDVEILLSTLKIWTFLKKYEEAIKVLEDLLDLGLAASLIEADPDLSDLRSRPQYEELFK